MTTAVAIELKPVTSSRITHVGHDPETFTLAIRFMPTKSDPAGPLYHYANVGEEMADDFLHAESLGNYFGAHLAKNPDHPCERIPNEPITGEAKTPVAIVPEIAEDADDMKLQALAVVTQVKSLSIVSAEEYTTAGCELVKLRQMRKQAQERIDRIRIPALEAYRATLDLQRDVIGPYEQAELYLDIGMAGYRATEKADRLRREQAENAKRRLEAEAEQKRRHAEVTEQDAKAAEAQGQPEVADQIRQQPLPLMPMRVQGVVLPKDVPRVKGIIERQPVWKWRVKAGEEHLVPREYLMLNDCAINAAVRNQKNLTNIAGIEVWDEEAKVGVKT